MSPFTGLIKDSRIGKWCKRGAVLIAIAGTIQILLTLYALWGEYRQIQSNGQTPFDLNYLILSGATQLFASIMTTVFFALILYAVGVIILANAAPMPLLAPVITMVLVMGAVCHRVAETSARLRQLTRR